MNTLPPDFLVHDDRDAVGVVVVEGVAAGDDLSGWVMDCDKTINLAVNDPIPLGHKFALRDIRNGESIIKYGENINFSLAVLDTVFLMKSFSVYQRLSKTGPTTEL